MRSYRRHVRISVAAQVYNAATEATLSIAGHQCSVVIQQIRVVRTAGAASANVRPAILSAAGGDPATSIAREWRNALAAFPLYVNSIDVHTKTDASGKLYLQVRPDVDGDTFQVVVDLLADG